MIDVWSPDYRDRFLTHIKNKTDIDRAFAYDMYHESLPEPGTEKTGNPETDADAEMESWFI